MKQLVSIFNEFINSRSKNINILCEIGDRRIMSFIKKYDSKDGINVNYINMLDYRLNSSVVENHINRYTKILFINLVNALSGLENDIMPIISLCENKKIDLFININIDSAGFKKILRLIKPNSLKNIKLYYFLNNTDSLINNFTNLSLDNKNNIKNSISSYVFDAKYKNIFLKKLNEFMNVIEYSHLKNSYIDSHVYTSCVYFSSHGGALELNNLLAISFISIKTKLLSYKFKSNEYLYCCDLSKPLYNIFTSLLNDYIKNGWVVIDFSKVKSIKIVCEIISYLLSEISKQNTMFKEEIINYTKKIKPVSHNKSVRFSNKLYINIPLNKKINSICKNGRLKSILKKK